MEHQVEEVLRAVYITEENRVIVKNLAITQGIYGGALCVPGNYLISQTTRIISPFESFLIHKVVQDYWFIDPAYFNDRFNTTDSIPSASGLTMLNIERKIKNKTENPTFQTLTFKDPQMAHAEMTVAYILYMIDRYGSRTHDVLMDYGRSSKAIMKAFEVAIKEGCLERANDAKKPFLTREGRAYLHDYYGNDFNGYDE